MKKLVLGLFAIVTFAFIFSEQTMNSIHQFKVKDIEGNDFDFSSLKGKKIMVVNTASKCGLTPHYEELEALYKKYKDQNFVIFLYFFYIFAHQKYAYRKKKKVIMNKSFNKSILNFLNSRHKKFHDNYKINTIIQKPYKKVARLIYSSNLIYTHKH